MVEGREDVAALRRRKTRAQLEDPKSCFIALRSPSLKPSQSKSSLDPSRSSLSLLSDMSGPVNSAL